MPYGRDATLGNMNEPIALPAPPTAAPRRVVLLVKSVQIAHQAGFYLLNGRWHKIHQDKPAPAGAPVLAEKPASGHTRMTSEMWAQVYAHADNSNKATFVKKLDKLKEAFEAGDEKAILAGSYPNDTTNKKVVKVANYLLGLMGSEHTVHPGLKQGTHHTLTGEVPAVSKPVEAPAPVVEPAPVAPEPVVEVKAPEPVAEVVADPVAAPEAPGTTLAMPAFVEGKNTTGVVDYYQEVGQKVIDLAAAGDVEGLHQLKAKGLEPNKSGKVGNTWKGKTENSKMLLAMQANAVAQIGGAALSAPVPAPVEAAVPAVSSKPSMPTDLSGHQQLAHDVKNALDSADHTALDDILFQTEGATPGSALDQVDGYAKAAKAYLDQNGISPAPAPAEASEPASAKDSMGMAILAAPNGDAAMVAGFDYLEKVGTTPDTVGHVVDALEVAGHHYQAGKFLAAKNKAAEIKTSVASGESVADMVGKAGNAHEAQIAAIGYVVKHNSDLEAIDAAIDAMNYHGYAGGVAALKQIKADVTGAYGPKEGDTKQGADGMLVLKDGHWIKVDQGQPAADVHPIDAIPAPHMGDFNNPALIAAALATLKEKVKAEGISALKGVTKKMASTGKLYTTLPHPTNPDKTIKISGNVAALDKSHAQVFHHVEAMKVAAGKKAPTPKAKPSAPAAAPAPAHPSMDDWKQIGPQGGSNPGGKFIDPDGVEWYCKFPGDENMAKSEVLAAKLYAAAGISAQDAKLVTKDGKIGIASKWADVSKGSPAELAKAKGAKAGFAVDAWLANHDVVGLGFDNLQLDANGNAMRVDAGGSLEYRAQGAKKEFGDTVTEIDTLRDKSINDKSAAVFGKMTKADITASVANVLKVSSAQIYALVNTYGPGNADDKAKLAATLIARKADLLAKYPKAKKEKKIEFKPENISAPPSFTNWGGSGNSGPSSKEFINLANEKAVQSIYTAAQTGNPEAVKGLSAETFNKSTGEVTGAAPVLEHPSQHVKGYAQQALNEIHQQLNPPKVFRFDGGHPLHSLNAAYPSLSNATHGETVAKAGKFLVLGAPGVVDMAALGLTPTTWASGQLTQATYSPVANAIIKAMPVTQKEAIRAYTGADYKKMNSSLWGGNPSGAAKAAAEALDTLGHEIAPGTILSRKLTVTGTGLDQILASTGKVLQEPAIMSTSVRPSSWHGNVQLKMHVGPGVKGLWVGIGSNGHGGALSLNSHEDELVLPPNTRILVLSVKKVSSADADGFGDGINHVIEAVILPSEQPTK